MVTRSLSTRISLLSASGPLTTTTLPDRSNLKSRFSALAALPFRVRSAADVARSARLGDACLALGGTYAADLERHAEVLAALDGDLTALIERLRQAAEAEDPRARYFGPD